MSPRPLTFGEILDEAAAVARAGFGRLLLVMVALYAPITALLGGALHLLAPELVRAATGQPDPARLLATGLGAGLALFFLECAAAAVAATAAARHVADACADRRPSVPTYLRGVAEVAPRAAAAGLLWAAMWLVASALPALVLVGAAFGAGASLGGPEATRVLVVLAALLAGLVAFGAGLSFAVRYGLAFGAMGIEGLGVQAAFARAVDLARGQRMRSLALLAVLVGMGFALAFAASWLIPSPQFDRAGTEALAKMLPQLVEAQTRAQVVGRIAFALVGTYAFTAWGVLYIDLQHRP